MRYAKYLIAAVAVFLVCLPAEAGFRIFRGRQRVNQTNIQFNIGAAPVLAPRALNSYAAGRANVFLAAPVYAPRRAFFADPGCVYGQSYGLAAPSVFEETITTTQSTIRRIGP